MNVVRPRITAVCCIISQKSADLLGGLCIFVTSFLYRSSDEDSAPSGHGGSLYNGDTQVLYWADASSEIAFVVPTRFHELDVSPQFNSSCESAHLSGQGNIYIRGPFRN